MFGACYLTEWTPSVEQMYELGTEIETYRTPDELTGKLAELMAAPLRRRRMRERAQRHALHEHSVGRSIARLAARLSDQAVQDRQPESCRFAASRHRAGKHVLAGDGRRNRVLLDGGWAGEAHFFDPAQKVRVESELGERHESLSAVPGGFGGP